MAFGLAAYVSRDGYPPDRARLASGCLSSSPGRAFTRRVPPKGFQLTSCGLSSFFQASWHNPRFDPCIRAASSRSPFKTTAHFFTVCRYVERNALRANLVQRAEDWRWGSLHRWRERSGKELLAAWPLRRLANWVQEVNAPQAEAELAALRRSVDRGCPFGEALWSDQIARRLGLE